MEEAKPLAGTGGERYIPFDERTGDRSVVYFTRDRSPEGLIRIYDRVCGNLSGNIAVKLHTGEPQGPNIIPRPWVKALLSERLPGAKIIETNTYYTGKRFTTEQHRETIRRNGWTEFAEVDITDESGTAMLPVKNGKWFREMSVGKSMLEYDSMLTLTHFKGHMMGGFGGSNKNIGIGCADGRIGKAMIHTTQGSANMWDIDKEELMERITESTSATVGFFGKRNAFINVLRNMSVSCDCEGIAAAPVVTPDIGILGSQDILSADQASVDLVYALPELSRRDLVRRMETRHGLRQLSYMKEMGLGNDRYTLIDIDNGDREITAAEAVKGIKGGWKADSWQAPARIRK